VRKGSSSIQNKTIQNTENGDKAAAVGCSYKYEPQNNQLLQLQPLLQKIILLHLDG
jgi:hypothetical protein